MKPQTFTQAIVRHMLRDRAGTAQTAREWREAYPTDPEQAALEFARQLVEDFREDWNWASPLPQDVFQVAFRKVNWLAIAKHFLDRFAPSPEKQQVIFRALRITCLN